MKKIMNFRPLFVAFVCMLCAGLLLPVFYFLPNYLKAIIFIILFAILAVFIFYKKNLFKYFAFTIIPFVLIFCIGGIRANINNQIIDDVYNANIEVVCTDSYYKASNSIVVRNAKINNISISSEIRLYVTGVDVETLEAGTKLKFVGNFSKNNKFVFLNQNFMGSISLDINNAQISKGSKTLIETIRVYVKNNLSKIKNQDVSDLCYAVLFGNKNNLDHSIKDSFTFAGTSHLLAISGLHVGFLIAVVIYILKICKAGRKTKLIVPLLFLIALMFLCAFTPSVVRASVVAIVYLFADFFGKEKDPLSSLSLAGIILLVANPFNSLKYGFLLSFACVFSILCLAKPLTTFFTKIKIGKKMSQTFATILSVNLATIPLVTLMNHQLNLMALISNIFLIPLFSLFYMVLFVFTFITAFLPFASIILNFVIAPYYLFSFVQNLFAGIPPIIANSNIILVITTLVLIFVLGRYVFLKPKIRAIISLALVAAIVINFTVINITYLPNENLLYFERSEMSIITTANHTVVAVTDELNNNTPLELKTRLKSLNISKINALVYSGDFDLESIKLYLDNCDIPLIIKEPLDYSVSELFKYDNFYITGSSKKDSTLVKDIYVYTYESNNIDAFVFEIDDKNLIFTNYLKNNKAVVEISQFYPQMVYAKYISRYVTNTNLLKSIVSLSEVEAKGNFSILFYNPLKVKY